MPIVGVANTSVAVVVLHQSVSGEKDMVGVPLQLLRVFAGKLVLSSVAIDFYIFIAIQFMNFIYIFIHS